MGLTNPTLVGITTTGNVGIGTINPTSKLVVSGTIGIDGSSSTAGRTQLSSSASGFVINHNDNSPIIIQNQSVDRLRIGAGGTVTVTTANALTETRGSYLRITNSGGGDAVISWDNTNSNANQRWYAGIDVSDGASWKLARPDISNFDSENFDRTSGTIGLTETKLKIDTSGNASFLGGLTLNTNKFTVAGATGNTTIAGSLSISDALNLTVSSVNKFSVDTSGNVTNAGTLTATGAATLNSTLTVTSATTLNSTLGVLGQITAPSFKVTSAIDESLLLRATGVAKAFTKNELDAAAGFVVQPPVTNSTLPNGNSIQLLPLTFDGNGASGTRIFALQKVDNTAFTPISAANLLVSVGGVIQKPDTDYTVSGTNITFPGSTWPNPPTAGLSCFIIAFGGLGGLTQNQDWDGDKGVLLVGSATDNLGIKLGVGSNNQILTANSGTESGLIWSTNFAGNATTATNLSNTGTVTLATATESNSIYITQPSYTTDQPVKLLNFDWYGNFWSLGNIRSGDTGSNGFGIYSSGTERLRITTTGLDVPNNSYIKVGSAYLSSGTISGAKYTHLANSTWYNGSDFISDGTAGCLYQQAATAHNWYTHSGVGGVSGYTQIMTLSATGTLTAATFSGSLSGNATTATTAASCTGNSATATTAASCSGNSATATTAASCSGNAASVTNGVYTTNFPNNFSGKGYQQFPGGFTIQWGTSSSLSQQDEFQTFATPFTAAVFSVLVTPNGGGGNSGDKKDHWLALGYQLDGFTLRSYFENGAASYSWVAFGA